MKKNLDMSKLLMASASRQSFLPDVGIWIECFNKSVHANYLEEKKVMDGFL